MARLMAHVAKPHKEGRLVWALGLVRFSTHCFPQAVKLPHLYKLHTPACKTLTNILEVIMQNCANMHPYTKSYVGVRE